MASERAFGYKRFENRAELQKALFDLYYSDVMCNIRVGLAASVYTQVSDVEDEINGLFTYDRAKEKVDADQLAVMGHRIQEYFLSIVSPEEDEPEASVAEEIHAEEEHAAEEKAAEEAPAEETAEEPVEESIEELPAE